MNRCGVPLEQDEFAEMNDKMMETILEVTLLISLIFCVPRDGAWKKKEEIRYPTLDVLSRQAFAYG